MLTMNLKGLLTCGVMTTSLTISACMWDRDTLAHEATAMPDVIQVVTGRFDRNPPLYFRMRIERETVEVRRNPTSLELYDDISVAYDRLGDDERAIHWIEEKHIQMGDLSAAHTKDGKRDAFSKAAYRYFANAGTFWIHRWLRRGGKVSELQQAKHARELIAKALEINPNAHFGRETVQLRVMDWMIEAKKKSTSRTLGDTLADSLSDEEANRRIKGLVGLIVLGNAWESPDIFEGLSALIDQEAFSMSRLGMFVSLREKELLDEGHKALVADKQLRADQLRVYEDGGKIRSEYWRLRNEAKQWASDRLEFMLTRLKKGLHPDTDAHFWDGYVNKPVPTIDYGLFSGINVGVWVWCLASLTLFVLAGIFVRRSVRRNSDRKKLST